MNEIIEFILAHPNVEDRRDILEWYEQRDPAKYADLRNRVRAEWEKRRVT